MSSAVHCHHAGNASTSWTPKIRNPQVIASGQGCKTDNCWLQEGCMGVTENKIWPVALGRVSLWLARGMGTNPPFEMETLHPLLSISCPQKLLILLLQRIGIPGVTLHIHPPLNHSYTLTSLTNADKLLNWPVNSLFQNSSVALNCVAAPTPMSPFLSFSFWVLPLTKPGGALQLFLSDKFAVKLPQNVQPQDSGITALPKHKQFSLLVWCSVMNPARSSSLGATPWREDTATLEVKPLPTNYSFDMLARSCLPTWISVSSFCATLQIQSKLPERVTH